MESMNVTSMPAVASKFTPSLEHYMGCIGRRCSSLIFGLSLSGGFTPCRHLRPSSGPEHTTI